MRKKAVYNITRSHLGVFSLPSSWRFFGRGKDSEAQREHASLPWKGLQPVFAPTFNLLKAKPGLLSSPRGNQARSRTTQPRGNRSGVLDLSVRGVRLWTQKNLKNQQSACWFLNCSEMVRELRRDSFTNKPRRRQSHSRLRFPAWSSENIYNIII